MDGWPKTGPCFPAHAKQQGDCFLPRAALPPARVRLEWKKTYRVVIEVRSSYIRNIGSKHSLRENHDTAHWYFRQLISRSACFRLFVSIPANGTRSQQSKGTGDRSSRVERKSVDKTRIYIYSNNSRMLICEFSRIHLRNRKIWRNNKTIRGIGQLEAWWLSIDESFFSTSRFQGLTQGCTIDAVPRTNRGLYTLPYPWSVTVFVPSLLEPWIPLEPR